jgi:hypothetical protein
MKKLFLTALLLALSVCAFAQQDYVGRYDAFAGYAYLDTPKLNLMERGFITQEGINLNRWLAFGVDFSVIDGHSTIFPNDTKLASTLNAEVAGLKALGQLPPNYVLFVPFNSVTYTYTAGPQINIRKFKKVTIFIHPDIGAIHETVTARPNPADPFQTAVVNVLAPNGGKISDTTYFYGIGGGAQYHLTPHVGIRVTADFVHLYLFSDLLASSRSALRMGVGPYFNFGKNVSR